MLVNKSFKVILLLLGGIFIVLQGLAFELEGAAVSAVMLTILTILYCKWTENKSKLFLVKLVEFFASVINEEQNCEDLSEELKNLATDNDDRQLYNAVLKIYHGIKENNQNLFNDNVYDTLHIHDQVGIG